MKKSIILISVLAMMSVNSVLGAVKAVPIQGTTFDTNNSQETKNANVSLKILDASMSEYNNIRVKAVLEDKSNPAQYKEFKFTASYGGVDLESFQILENNEWKNLDSYPIDRFGAPTGTLALVDMYCEYNSDLIFYLPKYIAGNPSRELPNPVSGHFKLKYCGYEAEFYIKDNKLSNENNYNNDNNNNNLVNDDLTLLDKKEMDDFTGLKDGYYYLNGVKLVNKWVEIEGKGYYFDSDGKNYKFNP